MPRRDRDYEPNRVQKGSDRMRWFFGLFGIKSARRKREEREDEDDTMTEEIPFTRRCEEGTRSYDVLFHVKDEPTEITVSVCSETPEDAVNDAIERLDVPQGDLLLDRAWAKSHRLSIEGL